MERRGRVLTVTMDRPPRNASNSVMHRELSTVFRDIARDAATDVVVLTGAGEAFCAGGDLGEMRDRLDRPDIWAGTMREAREIVLGLVELDKPVVARVNGAAIGLGCTLALLCDVIVAVETARLADPHVRIGLAAGDGGAIAWPLAIGVPRAKEFLLTGDAIAATDAAAMGLINRAVPAAELDAVAYGFAGRLAGGSQAAIRGTKRAINLLLQPGLRALVDAQLGIETLTFLGPDHREGVQAALEKRAPDFTVTPR
jgi:enoyl-CoA hydratase